MISLGANGGINVGWIQNGIKLSRRFKSIKEAERFQEIVDAAQNAMRLAEEMDRFNRDFKYDPKLVELKNAELGKEIEEMKERIRLKQTLQKKLGEAQHKLSEQPRNIIDRASFMKEMKEIRSNIDRLDRFFKEHAILTLNKSLTGAVEDMKTYFKYQKESIKGVEKLFSELKQEVVNKIGSVTTKDRVLSLNEATKYLGVSRATIEMMFADGLPYFRLGSLYKIKENDLKKWIEKRKSRLTSLNQITPQADMLR